MLLFRLLVVWLALVVALPVARAARTGSALEVGRRRSKRSLRTRVRAPKGRAKRGRRRSPPIRLVNVNRRKNRQLTLRAYDRRGRLRPAARRQLTSFLRCRRTGRRHAIHPRLIRLLDRVSRHFGGRAIYVYSGFRHRSIARLKNSNHTRGQALDFRVAGVSKRRLRDYLMRAFKGVGVGYYTRSPFVHLDVRRRSAFWIDFSGPGEPPRYAANPYQLLAQERRAVRSRRRRRANAAPSRIRPVGPAPRSWTKVAALGRRSAQERPGGGPAAAREPQAVPRSGAGGGE